MNATSFVKGRQKTGGRKAGTPNKSTRSIKEGLIIAAENIGADGHGAGGLGRAMGACVAAAELPLAAAL